MTVLLDGRVCKVADFSLALHKDEEGPLTDYVSTRWYRAPEVALGGSHSPFTFPYLFPIDIFAVGCIAAELFTGKTLFPGTNESDQFRLIFNFLGSPAANGWKEGDRLFQEHRVNLSPKPGRAHESLKAMLPLEHNKTVTVDFLKSLLSVHPDRRSTAAKALQHPFFYDVHAEQWVNEPVPQTTVTPFAEDGSTSSDASTCTTPSSNNLFKHKPQMVTISPVPVQPERSLSEHVPTALPFSPPLRNPYATSTKKRISSP